MDFAANVEAAKVSQMKISSSWNQSGEDEMRPGICLVGVRVWGDEGVDLQRECMRC
jgi:hypothetical protein